MLPIDPGKVESWAQEWCAERCGPNGRRNDLSRLGLTYQVTDDEDQAPIPAVLLQRAVPQPAGGLGYRSRYLPLAELLAQARAAADAVPGYFAGRQAAKAAVRTALTVRLAQLDAEPVLWRAEHLADWTGLPEDEAAASMPTPPGWLLEDVLAQHPRRWHEDPDAVARHRARQAAAAAAGDDDLIASMELGMIMGPVAERIERRLVMNWIRDAALEFRSAGATLVDDETVRLRRAVIEPSGQLGYRDRLVSVAMLAVTADEAAQHALSTGYPAATLVAAEAAVRARLDAARDELHRDDVLWTAEDGARWTGLTEDEFAETMHDTPSHAPQPRRWRQTDVLARHRRHPQGPRSELSEDDWDALVDQGDEDLLTDMLTTALDQDPPPSDNPR